MVAHENLFVIRFRVVPERAGTLEIPAIQAQIEGRSGRSQPKSVSIQAVPLLGRPAEFLGGVGRFELHAEASRRSCGSARSWIFGSRSPGRRPGE